MGNKPDPNPPQEQVRFCVTVGSYCIAVALGRGDRHTPRRIDHSLTVPDFSKKLLAAGRDAMESADGALVRPSDCLNVFCRGVLFGDYTS
jgi:hypothetical protein